MNFETITTEVCELAKETALFIAGEVNQISAEKIESKSLHNFVTYVDKTSEERIIKGLSSILPGSGFIAEEGTIPNENRQYTWVIDPLDGTTNFLHGLPPYAISIALMEQEKVHLGVIHEVYSGECFRAWDESPAFLNGKEIHVSPVSSLKDALIATGFPYSDFDKLKPFMQSLEYLFNHSHGVRRLGSAAIDIAYLAAGRFEGFYEYGLSPWDVAAGVKILLQAGGKVSDFRGGNDYIFGREIIATNAALHSEFASLISSYFRK